MVYFYAGYLLPCVTHNFGILQWGMACGWDKDRDGFFGIPVHSPPPRQYFLVDIRLLWGRTEHLSHGVSETAGLQTDRHAFGRLDRI